jgi:hypothetical protein
MPQWCLSVDKAEFGRSRSENAFPQVVCEDTIHSASNVCGNTASIGRDPGVDG